MPFLEVPESFLNDFAGDAAAMDLEGGRRKKRSPVKGCTYSGSKVYKTKKGSLYVYLKSGRTRFVKKSHCKMSRRR
jgi:hypothetical protein